MKRCRKCGETKVFAEFRVVATTKDGRCSWCKECHRQAGRAWRAEHGARYNAERRVEPYEKTCAVCGTSFTTKNKNRAYCARPCRERMKPSRYSEKTRAASRNRNHLRRVARTGGDLSRGEAQAMRDAVRKCPLCGCYMTSRPKLPNSKELDHIVPIGVGGTHTAGNVRVICRGCNLRRPKDGGDYVGPVSLWAVAV